MRKLTAALALLLITCPTHSLGEELVDAEGRSFMLSMHEKVRRSAQAAQLIARGRFILPDESDLRASLLEIQRIDMDFVVVRQLGRGNVVPGHVLRLGMRIYSPAGGRGECIEYRSPELALRLGGAIRYGKYLTMLKDARQPLLADGCYGRDYVLAHVLIGFCPSIRRADVLITPGRQYVLFLSKDEGTMDLYEADEPALIGNLPSPAGNAAAR